jgi:transposase
MTIVMGLDQHRAQITAEWIDTDTGELARARLAPAHRDPVRRFLARFAGRELEVALEATTGWRFVVEELRTVGAQVHLAEPAETSALRGSKKRPKTDRADARHLRELLMLGKLPECWIPPEHLLDLRARVRLRHTLIDDRGCWQQRMRAVLYHHGIRHRRELVLLTAEGRDWLAQAPLPDTAREQVTVALQMIDALDRQLPALDRQLRAYARHQTGCKALMGHYGIGELSSVAILAELGDCRRFSSSRHAVRYVGLDITVYQSDQRRAPGHLSRQGPSTLRWALYEAAQAASRAGSPDRDYYLKAAERLGHKRACLTIARKLLKRSYTRCENSATRRSCPRELLIVAPAPHLSRCTAASSRQIAAATPAWTARKDRAAAPHFPQREPPPITIMSPAHQPPRDRGPR